MGQRQIAHVNINGVPEGIFEFLFCTRDFGPPRVGGQPPPRSKKSEKFFFDFRFFFGWICKSDVLFIRKTHFRPRLSSFSVYFRENEWIRVGLGNSDSGVIPTPYGLCCNQLTKIAFLLIFSSFQYNLVHCGSFEKKMRYSRIYFFFSIWLQTCILRTVAKQPKL